MLICLLFTPIDRKWVSVFSRNWVDQDYSPIWHTGRPLGGCIGCGISAIIVHYFCLLLCINYNNELLDYYYYLNNLQYTAIVIIGAFATVFAEFYGGKYDNLFIAPITSITMHIFSELLY